MLEQLFGSKTRIKLLRLFLNHPGKAYFVREITRVVKSQINSVRRELENLESIGLIMTEVDKGAKKGKKKKRRSKQEKKYFKINEDNILFPELKALLLKAQLLLERDLVKSLSEVGNINYLALTGMFVGLKDCSTDILIVGKINHKSIARLVRKFERELGKEINYTVMSTSEYNYRKDVTDKFLYSILENKRIVIIDKMAE